MHKMIERTAQGNADRIAGQVEDLRKERRLGGCLIWGRGRAFL